MNLSFLKAYEDYTDSANWQPRLSELTAIVSGITAGSIGQLDDQALLDTMEDVEELMRYYCVIQDMAKLEAAMRKFYDMLQLCKSRQIRNMEALYLEMVFLRMDAMLYRSNGQNRQSAQSYDRCLTVARQCFDAMLCTHLTKDQQLYVGWNCVECWREAAEVHDLALDTKGSVQLLREVIPMLQKLEPHLPYAPGICDQAAELYTNAGSILYQYGDPATGSTCYQNAYHLLSMLDIVHGSDFYMARAIWVRCVHGTMALMIENDAKMMLRSETEAQEYLRQRPEASLRDRTIVEAVNAMVLIQRSMAFQQNGKMAEAIRMTKTGVEKLGHCLDVLQKNYEGRYDHYRTVLEKITGRIYGSYVGAMESLGVMYFQNEDGAAAKEMLQEVLTELSETGGIRIQGSSSAMIHAETLQYLGFIALDEGNGYQADFYGTQAADMALSLGEETGNPLAWGVAVISCSLVAEMALGMKNKPKAKTYAEKGLTACDTLARLNPNSPQLQMRGNLEKFYKKASRRFF